MIDQLQKHFVKLEKEKDQLMELLTQTGFKQLYSRPAQGKWSAMQVVWHMMLAEKISFKYIEKRMKNADQYPVAGLKSRLLSFMVIHGLNLPLKFKAGVAVGDVPSEPALEDLEKQWEEVRIHMKAVLDQATDENASRCLYIHPVAGPMNLFDAMRFMVKHFLRHKRQLMKCLDGS